MEQSQITIENNVGDSQEQQKEDQNTVKEQMDKLMDLVGNDFKRAVTQLINEIDLLFDYVPLETKNKLQKYSERISSDKEFRVNEMKIILEKFKPFEDKIYRIAVVKKKIKTSDLQFLDTMVLFEDMLDMKLFSNENKNTKVSMVNYLSSMYMAASFGSVGINENFNMGELSHELTNFVESIKQKAELSSANVTRPVRPILPIPTSAHPNGMGGLLNTIMSNPDIMSMAADLTQDLQNQNLDPIALMSSLMSGKPNGQIESLISKITNKLEAKMSSGELNKDALEKQAENIMRVVQSSDLTSQVPPMLQQLLQSGNLNQNLKTQSKNKKQ